MGSTGIGKPHRVILAVSVGIFLWSCPESRPVGKAGEGLVVATISDPKTFNPLLVTDTASGQAVGGIFEGLVRLNPRTTLVEPHLARSWEYGGDGTVCTFHLRRDVQWHDGVPFTAEDVAFTFDAVYHEKVPNSAKHILTIDGQRMTTEVVDRYTVRFVLPRPFAPLLNSIGIEILPKHILAHSLDEGTFTQQWGVNTPPSRLVGTGPYTMVKYVPAQFIQYRRNPRYWMKDESGDPLPYLDKSTLLIVPDQNTVYLRFSAGHIHYYSPRPEEIQDLREKKGRLDITLPEIGLDTGTLFLTFNRNPRHYVTNGHRDPRLEWFTDKNFLRAVAHSIDKASMIRNCLYGYGEPAVAEVSPENKIFHNPHLTDYPYDLEKARDVLRRGGYRDRDGDGVIEDRAGNPVEFTLHTNAGNQVREKMCSILKEDWTKLGFKVNYRPLDFTTLVEKLNVNFDWDSILIGFTGGIEPHNGANLLRSSGNLHMWNPAQEKPASAWEAEIDRLLEEGSRELDLERRKKYYWRIQEILHQELPMIQLVRQKQYVAFKNSLRNFSPTVWGLYRPERIQFVE